MERITEFLVNFGKSLGLESFVDEVGNVIIRKPATPGMENRKGVILQAHMDMVPQKGKASNHNFETDPIETYAFNDSGSQFAIRWVKSKLDEKFPEIREKEVALCAFEIEYG
jgi:di/tripeptidase